MISLLRLCIVVSPLAWMFARSEHAASMLWWAFTIAELVAFVAAALLLLRADHKIFKLLFTLKLIDG